MVPRNPHSPLLTCGDTLARHIDNEDTRKSCRHSAFINRYRPKSFALPVVEYTQQALILPSGLKSVGTRRSLRALLCDASSNRICPCVHIHVESASVCVCFGNGNESSILSEILMTEGALCASSAQQSDGAACCSSLLGQAPAQTQSSLLHLAARFLLGPSA